MTVYSDFEIHYELTELIYEFMISKGFKLTEIKNKPVYEKDGEYVMFTISQGMKAIFIEWAETYEYAMINFFEDVQSYKLEFPLEELIEPIKSDIIKYLL